MTTAHFPITVELSSVRGTDVTKTLEEARALKADAFNFPDGILGRLTISPIILAHLIKKETGKFVIAHLTCRDRTRLALASELLGAHALNIDGILALTGDAGKKNVFEINSTGLIKLITDLNRGELDGKPLKGGTNLKIFAAVNPAVENQLEHLKEKIEAGAEYVQTQPVFDAEVAQRFLERAKKLPAKILLGILPLKNLKVAEYFNAHVTGITVPKKVMERLEKGGAEAGLECALELLEELRDLLDGVHLMPLGDVAASNRIYNFLKNI
jgi:5,10-methylenetetrahydrofolate reductase